MVDETVQAAYRGCPYFGLVDDAHTRLLFASPIAECHRVTPTETINIEYQQTTCLSELHLECPVFLWADDKTGRLPRELRAAPGANWQSVGRFVRIVGVLLLLVVMVFLISWGASQVFGQNGAGVSLTAVAEAPTLPPAVTTEFGASLTQLSEIAINTATATPEETSSAVAATATPLIAEATATPATEVAPSPTPRGLSTPLPPDDTDDTAESSEAVSPLPDSVPQVRVVFSSVSLRLGPGTNYGRMRYLRQDDTVAVLSRTTVAGQKWYYVEFENLTRGWLAADVTEAINPELVEAVRFVPVNSVTPIGVTPTVAVASGGTAAPGGGPIAGGPSPGSGVNPATRPAGTGGSAGGGATPIPGAPTQPPPPPTRTPPPLPGD